MGGLLLGEDGSGWVCLCDEYFSKKGEESFPGDEGHDHIPEQSDEVGEQDLVLHRHEPEINGRGQRPDLPVVDHHLLILILAGLDSLLPGLDITVCHDLVNREEECHKDRREDQLVDRHRAEHLHRLRYVREDCCLHSWQQLAVPKMKARAEVPQTHCEEVQVTLPIELFLLEDWIG